MVEKVISNGFDGSDQGALASAFLNNIPIDGYAPKDYNIGTRLKPNLKYLGLKEFVSDKIADVIKANLEMSDLALFFIKTDSASAGSYSDVLYKTVDTHQSEIHPALHHSSYR